MSKASLYTICTLIVLTFLGSTVLILFAGTGLLSTIAQIVLFCVCFSMLYVGYAIAVNWKSLRTPINRVSTLDEDMAHMSYQ
jgi:hypothetical protein